MTEPIPPPQATVAAVLISPAPSPSKPPIKITMASSKRKRSAVDDTTREPNPQTASTAALPSSPPPQQALTMRSTMPYHTSPKSPREKASLSSAPRFAFISPMPTAFVETSDATDNSDGIEIDGTPPYLVSPSSVDGGSSPRTRVAQRFQSLAIASSSISNSKGGSRTNMESGGNRDAGEDSYPFPDMSGAEGGDMETDNGPVYKRMKQDVQDAGGAGSSPSSSPPTTPPLSSMSQTLPLRVVVDPLRASLTWQEDEITVYDPNDADDDGTGINGIGFKPTPAIAHARALKRRQQLVEYRKREEREARAWRSLHRARAHQQAAAAAVRVATVAAATSVTEVKADGTASAPASALTPLAPPIFSKTQPAGAPSTSPLASSPVRRVRFLETGPVTIHFLEPDPVPVTSTTSMLTSMY